MGPLKKYVDHLSELNPHPDDETVLSQGSLFSARIFLAKQKERQLVCALVTDSISMQEFVNSADIATESGDCTKK